MIICSACAAEDAMHSEPSHTPHRAVELALLIIRNGGTTAAAERAFVCVMTALGETGTLIFRLDFLLASSDNAPNNWTISRSIGPMGLNMGRVSAAMALSERVASGQLDGPGLANELHRIEHMEAPVS